jgi:hypothetical protein
VNALARTLQMVEFLISFPHPVPRPTLADLFLVLQYPWYLLALLLVPLAQPAVRRTLMVVDGCLLLGAAFALSWYFLLAPINQSSHESLLGKLVNLSLPLGDLAFFFGLTMIWLRYRESAADRTVVVLLITACICLIVADSWYALLLLNASGYQVGSPPDLFWMAFILLVPLSGLVRFRLAQRMLASGYASPPGQQSANLRRQDLFAGLRVTAPVAAAMLVSAVLFIHDEVLPSGLHPIALLVVALFLLGLALVRQGPTAVENERLRREREEALREKTTQMETLVGITGHELKNPLASIQLALALIERRVRRLLQREQVEMTDVAPLLEPVVEAEH